jgi:uncharacterized membrane protein YraQ (UPF0718 family)
VTDQSWNPWKMTAIALVLTVVTAVVTGVVIANWSGRDVAHKTETPSVAARPAATARTTAPAPAATPAPAAAPQPASLPSQATIDACNQHAAAQSSQRSNTKEVVIDGAIGAVAGAAVGAAGGAIAGGGSGAGKGAVIGGVLGAGGGALYGVNENRKNDAQYRDVYASCMRARGYTG